MNSRFRHFGILPGSERDDFPAEVVGETPAHLPITVSIHLKRKLSLSLSKSVLSRKFMTRTKLEEEHGAAYHDVKLVSDFAEHFGLTVLQANMCGRMVVLAGSAAQMMAAFRVRLIDRRYQGKLIRTRVGPIFLPSELLGSVSGVFGLDNRPQALPHFRLSQRVPSRLGLKPDAFTGSQLAEIYNFPQANGQGQTIALIELGGGYETSDIAAYFTAMSLNIPVVKSVSVAGGTNSPGVDAGADTEVALDIQVAGAVSPDATIVVYFAPNTSQGFLQAVHAAINDTVNKPSVVSISWGAAEAAWTEQLMTAMDEAFQSAAAVGVSVFVAAGDDGADDNVGDGKAHVDFPASSPSVTSCGGTSLTVTNSKRHESVWNDGDGSASGGGISDVFARPAYQQALSMPSNLNGVLQGRGVPDVAAVADPYTGYAVLVNGFWTIVGGTSAVAPLFAGLLARLNQLMGRSNGCINTFLYGASTCCNDILGGNNSCDGVTGYPAVAGWDAVTGLGSPDGTAFQHVLEARNSL